MAGEIAKISVCQMVKWYYLSCWPKTGKELNSPIIGIIWKYSTPSHGCLIYKINWLTRTDIYGGSG